jgi:hypothetical protein
MALQSHRGPTSNPGSGTPKTPENMGVVVVPEGLMDTLMDSPAAEAQTHGVEDERFVADDEPDQ